MSLVVSDTSPVRALAHLGRLDLLHALFNEVLIPPAVASELAEPLGKYLPIDARAIPELTIRVPRDTVRVARFRINLHAGESEALALAIEVGATAILMDEIDGRAAAVALGLRPVGVIGILTASKKQGLVPQVRPLLDRLINEINFFVSQSLYVRALHDAGEST